MGVHALIKKIISKCTRRFSTKHERATSLRECLDSSTNYRKRRWKPWLNLGLVITAFYFMYICNKDQFSFDTMRGPQDETDFRTKIAIIELTPNVTKAMQQRNTTQSLQYKIEDQTPITVMVTSKPINEVANSIANESKNATSPEKVVHCIPKKKRGKINLLNNSLNVTFESLERMYPLVQKGGYYHPPDCSPQQKIGILVPYRDRETSLRIFLYNIHPFLMNQQLEYQIFVIEQSDWKPFNKGRLFNAGFKEMQKYNTFNCIVMHDVDLLPLDDRILYSCPSLPRHMSSWIRTKDLKAANMSAFDSKFGGVTSMTVEQYNRANGFSNVYFGWGGEDNDMMNRLRAAGYPMVRYNRSVAVYAMLPHFRAPMNPDRFHLLASSMDRYKVDGLTDIKYVVVSRKLRHLYTHLVVNIDPTNDHDIIKKRIVSLL